MHKSYFDALATIVESSNCLPSLSLVFSRLLPTEVWPVILPEVSLQLVPIYERTLY